MLSLLAPALRMVRALRVLRAARALRGLRLVRMVGTANRGMNALRAGLGRRGTGWVVLLTGLVALLGAGGMLAFEPASEVEGGFASYGEALWWTAMLLTTMGSEFWPRTAEGRVLCFLLSLYGFAVFGYITASFTTFFVGRDAADAEAEAAGARDLAALRDEVAALRQICKSQDLICRTVPDQVRTSTEATRAARLQRHQCGTLGRAPRSSPAAA